MLKSATSNKNNENNNIIINNDNYHYFYSNKITIMRCGLGVFFGGFRQISAYFGHSVYFGLSSNRIKLPQTPYPLGFNNNIYHEGILSQMPDFDVFSLLEFRKRTARSHGIKKNRNCKRKSRAQKLATCNCTPRDLATKLGVRGRHCMLSYLRSLPISVLRSLDTEADKFYDRTNRLYDAASHSTCSSSSH